MQEHSRYQFEKLLGEGAMGEVLLARDPDLERPVAYKRLLSGAQVTPAVLRRFLLEARITAQLDHPHIVPIYQLETLANGQLGYTMKPISGTTLKDLLAEARSQYATLGQVDEPHGLSALLAIFLKVCDALDYAHSKGVIHRDLKPANLMIGAYGEVYVMDWGIARVMSEAEEALESGIVTELQADPEERTQMGQVLGTLRYMSPQQAAGKNDALDGRSDQFALGLILFEIVTLQQAFQAADSLALLKTVLKAEKAPYQHVAQQPIARELKAIIERATARKPEGRYPRVADLAEDVRRYLRNEAVMAAPDNLWQRSQRWLAHHPRMALLLVGSILLASATAVGMSLYQQQQTQLALSWREQQLSQLLTRHAVQVHRLDRQFQRAEGILRAAAAILTETLVFGPAVSGPKPAWLQAPLQAVSGMRLGTALTPELEKLWLLGATLDQAPLLPTEARQRLNPLRGLEVALRDGGRVSYPRTLGTGWEHLIGERRGEHWQPLTTLGGEPVLSCLTGLFDYQERPLGVARLTLGLKDWVTQGFTPDLPGLQRYAVLNAQGQVLIDNGQVMPDPPPFAQTSVRAAAAAGQAGYSEDAQLLYLYHPLAQTGWLHVAVFPRQILERR
jgi:serine/threonine-protein kinase